MHRARLQRSARSAPLFLHAARHHFVVAATRFEILLQQPVELRTQAPPPLRARAARLVRHAHEHRFESDLPPDHQISWTNAPSSVLATISKRRSALKAASLRRIKSLAMRWLRAEIANEEPIS